MKTTRRYNDLSAKQKKALAIGQALRIATCIKAQANALSRHLAYFGLPIQPHIHKIEQVAYLAIAELRFYSAQLAAKNLKARIADKNLAKQHKKRTARSVNNET